jgi:outer membrane protein TolC
VGGISSFNPSLSAAISFNFTQPLWQDLRIDSARANLETSQRSRSISDIQLQQAVIGFEVIVKNAYLNLVGAVEGRKVAQQNLDIADQSLKNARARVAVGASPQIDIIQFEAQVAGLQESLIAADGRIGTAEDSLRQLILDPSRPDYWTVRLELTDQITLTPFQVDLDAAIKNALANRLDLKVAQENVQITDLRLDLNKNLTLPSVDLRFTYSAQGTAGTQFQYGSGFPPPVLSRSDRSFGSALGDAFSGAYPNWSAFVQVGYPIGQTGARAALASVEILRRQQELDIRNLELQIVRDVREAARQVQNTFQRVQAARTARAASETQLDAEERRFQVGMSTNLDLQARQRELAGARNSELAAMISYNLALINFERVQRIQ